MIEHITLNFVVDRAGAMISILATARKPTDNERGWADWVDTLPMEGRVYHCLGRGGKMGKGAIAAWAAAHMHMTRGWVAVDLAPLAGR